MTEPAPGQVTRLLTAISGGQRRAADDLLPLVYDSLRRLARQKMAQESPGHTLQATALVHEAYLRLVGDDPTAANWDSRGHFYAAAAEAMRRILVERARKYQQPKHGGGRRRVTLEDPALELDLEPDDLLALDEAMKQLAEKDRQMYDVVMLRYFAGLTVQQVAEVSAVPRRTVDRKWRCARIWLYEQIVDDGSEGQAGA